MEEESETLLKEAENSTQVKQKHSLSKGKQRGLFLTILSLQGLALFESTSIITFFPVAARDKGLSTTQMGIVISAFSIARFIFSPICGSMVSIELHLY